jgi:D-cysteine desulfhydrase
VDDHVRQQLARLEASGAELHRYRDQRGLRLAAPWLVARTTLRDRRRPWYLPAGGSNPFGATAYVEAALELAAQVDLGLLPEPATVVTAVGSGGTAAGLALGLRMAGLRTRVHGVVVNDAFPLDASVIADLANQTARLLRERGGVIGLPPLVPEDVTMTTRWLGSTYGDVTPAARVAVGDAAAFGHTLEPVYTGKSVAAMRDVGGTPEMPEPILWLNTHGPR